MKKETPQDNRSQGIQAKNNAQHFLFVLAKVLHLQAPELYKILMNLFLK